MYTELQGIIYWWLKKKVESWLSMSLLSLFIKLTIEKQSCMSLTAKAMAI
jgi:hypothetical protein